MYGQDMKKIMDAKSLTIIWLSLQLAGLGYWVTKQAYRIGYLEGRAAVLAEQGTIDTPMNTCYGKACKNGRG
jgi:hypothetical protein